MQCFPDTCILPDAINNKQCIHANSLDFHEYLSSATRRSIGYCLRKTAKGIWGHTLQNKLYIVHNYF